MLPLVLIGNLRVKNRKKILDISLPIFKISFYKNTSFTVNNSKNQKYANSNIIPTSPTTEITSTNPTSTQLPATTLSTPIAQRWKNRQIPEEDLRKASQYSFEWNADQVYEQEVKSEELDQNNMNSSGMYDSERFILKMPGAGVAGVGTSNNTDRRRSVTPPLRSVRREDGDRRFNTGYCLDEKSK